MLSVTAFLHVVATLAKAAPVDAAEVALRLLPLGVVPWAVNATLLRVRVGAFLCSLVSWWLADSLHVGVVRGMSF